jgi:hypothetical protein
MSIINIYKRNYFFFHQAARRAGSGSTANAGRFDSRMSISITVSRAIYQKASALIGRLKNLTDSKEFCRYTAELKDRYKRRPAFLAEYYRFSAENTGIGLYPGE